METFKTLNGDDAKIVAEEESFLREIQNDIMQSFQRRRNDREHASKRLEGLRDEAVKAKADDLPALFDQMHTQRALMERSPEEKIPEPLSPYFAHMQLQENGKIRHVFLGRQTYLGYRKAPIIDWRHAPVARIFFNYREGDEYEEKLPGRLAMGTMVARRILSIEKGKLVQIVTPKKCYALMENGWHVNDGMMLPNLKGGAGTARRTQSIGTGQSGRPSPDIAALLDPDQFRILNSPSDDPLLILGGAGCGKTTVALHRMAYLNYKNPKKFNPKRMVVIVPEEGLVRLSGRLLQGLGLGKVEILTFDHWISRQARQIIRGLPRKVYPDTPGNVVRFKRHPAIRAAFKELVQQQVNELAKLCETKLPGFRPFSSLLRNRDDLSLLERIQLAEQEYLQNLKGAENKSKQQRRNVVHKFFDEVRREAMDVCQDRLDLFSNRDMLQWIVSHSQGQLAPVVIDQVLSHSVEQFGDSIQQRLQNVDSQKLATIDGTSLFEQERGEVSGTIDSEDFAILLELYFFKKGHASYRGSIKEYTHIVIDEAQDLAPLERNVLGRALAPDAAITIAGDSAQQIDPSTSFQSWEHVLDQLGVARVHANHLTTTYRSTEPIAAFAHKILGPFAPQRPPLAIKDGAPVSFSVFRNEGQLALMLNEALTDLITTEPHASIAIIAKEFETSQRLYEVLKDIPKTRLVYGGDFEFRPGIEITEASQVKGLEFDYVIIPDASFAIYHASPEDRRLMHVAATRAIHQLWVIALIEPSVIIKDIIPNTLEELT